MNARHDETLDETTPRISSSETHVVPATDMAALYAYTEMHVLRTAHLALAAACDDQSSFDSALGEIELRMDRGTAAIARVAHLQARAFLTDIDAVRAMPGDAITTPRGVWFAGVAAASAGVVSTLEWNRLVTDGGADARRQGVDLVRKLRDEARRRWVSYRDEILRAHPEIKGVDPAFSLDLSNIDKPNFIVPVTI